MQNAASIIQAVASICWPAFAFTTFFVFRREIASAIGRIKKGKLLGQEFELGEDLAKLQASAEATRTEVQALPQDKREPVNLYPEEELDSAINTILRQAAISPKTALIMLQAELERQTRNAIATRGLLRNRSGLSIHEALNELEQYGFPPNMSGSLKLFYEIRNKLVHGGATADDDILRAINSGITILRAVNALPNEVNIVYHPGVDVFSDPACKRKIPDVKGVILETTSPGGVFKNFCIFPTTRTYFRKGERVAWEWNPGRVCDAAWYHDPDTEEIKFGWKQAMEFVGRHLNDF